MNSKMTFIATVPLGLVDTCKQEIVELARRYPEAGIERVCEGPGVVTCLGLPEAVIYLNMLLRIPSRILLSVFADKPVGRARASGEGVSEAIRSLVRGAGIAGRLMSVDQTFVVDSSVKDTAGLSQHFLALLVKDGICDAFREHASQRPNVVKHGADVRFLARYAQGRLSLAIDTSGAALHVRGYRPAEASDFGQGAPGAAHRHEAPMRENLAAGILALSGWQEYCWHVQKLLLAENGTAVAADERLGVSADFNWRRDGADPNSAQLPALMRPSGVIDIPMCGSGTLAIEAARMLAGVALRRPAKEWAFMRLLPFCDVARQFATIENHLVTRGALPLERWQAWYQERHPQEMPGGAPVQASDRDRRSCEQTVTAARRAGVADWIQVSAVDFRATARAMPGSLAVINPPYGVRLKGDAIGSLDYGWIGDTLKQNYPECMAWIISADASAMKTIGLRATRRLKLYNGGLECQLQQFVMTPRRPKDGPLGLVQAQGAPAGLADCRLT